MRALSSVVLNKTDARRLTVVLFAALAALVLLLGTGCARKDDFQYCPAGQALPQATGAPSVLVIGDSISIGYTPTVLGTLSPKYDVVHNPCNAMTSTWTRSQIDGWLSSRQSFEAITWNNGLWDVLHGHRTSDETYADNLRYIAGRIKEKTAHPLFVLTTQVLPETANRSDSDVIRLNDIARAIMTEEGIPVLDLYSVSAAIQDEHKSPNDVHYTEVGSETLGVAVLGALSSLGVVP